MRPFKLKATYTKEIMYEAGYVVAHALAILFIFDDIPYVKDVIGDFYSTYFPRLFRYYFVGIPMVVALSTSIFVTEFFVFIDVNETLMYQYMLIKDYCLSRQTNLPEQKVFYSFLIFRKRKRKRTKKSMQRL